MKYKRFILAICVATVLTLSACGTANTVPSTEVPSPPVSSVPAPEIPNASAQQNGDSDAGETDTEKESRDIEQENVSLPPQAPSNDYDDCLDRAADEKADDARPALSGSVGNMDEYDVVFLGYPDWWAACPMAVFTFLDSYDFTGKTVIPFCAHGSSGLASSVRDIRAALPDVTVLDAVGVQRPGMNTPLSTAQATVETWLEGLKY